MNSVKRNNSNLKESRFSYRLTSFDVVLIAVVLLFSIGFILFTRFGRPWQSSKVSGAAVYHEGELLREITLDKDQELILLDGKMSLEIKEGRIRVSSSDCPRRLCVNMGWIKTPGQVIACVPNKVLIEIKSTASPFLDAVAY